MNPIDQMVLLDYLTDSHNVYDSGNTITLLIDNSVYKRLNVIAENECCSIGELIEYIYLYYLNMYERNNAEVFNS
jgi:predicted DNA-binding ribbon-helix-helix protein